MYGKLVSSDHLLRYLALSIGFVICVVAGQRVQASAIIQDGNVMLGVDDLGQLNVLGGPASPVTGTTAVGLRYVPTGFEATAHGCLCEGWGVSDGVTQGSANNASGIVGLSPVSFTSSATSATSVVATTDGNFRVTHDFQLSTATPDLYEVVVTIEALVAVPDVLYRRNMDWDVEPTTFVEFSTIEGWNSPSALIHTSNDGFSDSGPLSSDLPIGTCPVDADFVDCGPNDHGALFDFQFGPMAAGTSRTFSIFYGGSDNETNALAALAAVGSSIYSLGQASAPHDPMIGEPTTFIFGFKGVGETSCLSLTDEELLCALDDSGNLTYNVTLTNESGLDAAYVLLTPLTAGITFSPQQIGMTILDGDSASISTTVVGATDGEEFCFVLTLLTVDFEECCSVMLCLTPDCDCIQVPLDSLVITCDPDTPGTYTVMFTLDNLTGDTLEHIYFFPPAGVTVMSTSIPTTVNYVDIPTLLPLTSSGLIAIQVSGVMEGTRVCLPVSVHDAFLEECCGGEICLEFPECDIGGCVLTSATCSDASMSATTTLTICNHLSTPQSLSWSIAPLSASPACPAVLSAAAFSPSSGVTPVLAPGGCTSIPVTISCVGLPGPVSVPPTLSFFGPPACFESTVTSATGVPFNCGGMIRRSSLIIGGGGCPPFCPTLVGVPAGTTFEGVLELINPTEFDAMLPYSLASTSPVAMVFTVQPGVSSGQLLIPAGGMTDLPIALAYDSHTPLELDELHLMVEVEPGVTETIVSIATQSTPALDSIDEVICGDFDFDNDVDLLDFGQFQICYTGSGSGSIPSSCAVADCDFDNDVDLVDFASFQLAFTGQL
jgi:hypothetical protein